MTSALFPITDEVLISITKEGLSCFAMDPSHTEAASFDWSHERFSKYETDSDGQIDLKLSLGPLTSLFKRFGNDEDITISDKFNAMQVTDGKKRFTCALFLSDDIFKENPLSKMQYEKNFKLDIEKIEDMINDCKVFGIDIIFFETSDGKILYSGKEAAGNVNGVMVDEYEGTIEKIGFNYTFMESVLKSLKPYAEPEIIVSMRPKSPIRISFEIPRTFTLQYYLAPLVE